MALNDIIKTVINPFFAIGSMFTCFGGSFDDDAAVDSYFKLLRRSGIGWARETADPA